MARNTSKRESRNLSRWDDNFPNTYIIRKPNSIIFHFLFNAGVVIYNFMKKMLFHTYWDLLSSIVVRLWLDEGCSFTFVRSNLWIKLWKNLSLYQIKTSYHGKCLNDFYSCDALKKLTRSFFLMHRNSWIKIIRAHFPWNNLFFHNNEIHQ